jgi:hypothetical protein
MASQKLRCFSRWASEMVSLPRFPQLRDGLVVEDRSELNLDDASMTSAIWATGYRFGFSLVRVPVLDSDGYAIQKLGVTALPEQYFVELCCLHKAKSGLPFGLQQDATRIASIIVERALYSHAAQRPDEPKSSGNFDVVRDAPTIFTPLPIARGVR